MPAFALKVYFWTKLVHSWLCLLPTPNAVAHTKGLLRSQSFTVGIEHENLHPNTLQQISILIIFVLCYRHVVSYYKFKVNYELNDNQRMRPGRPLIEFGILCMQNNPHKKREIVGEILHETEVSFIEYQM